MRGGARPPPSTRSPARLDVGIPRVLPHEDEVNEDVVSRHEDLPTRLPRKDGTQQVGRVAQAPLDQEEDAEPAGGADGIIGEDLG